MTVILPVFFLSVSTVILPVFFLSGFTVILNVFFLSGFNVILPVFFLSGFGLVLQEYWVLTESRIPLKAVLGGMRIVELSIILTNRRNKTESAVFLNSC